MTTATKKKSQLPRSERPEKKARKSETYIMNTRFTYLYRDASNYKQRHEVIIKGDLTIPQIRCWLWEHMFFVPSAVGLPDLSDRFKQQGYMFPTDDDHPWHEPEECVPTDETSTVDVSAEEFIRRLAACHNDGWENLSLKAEARIYDKAAMDS